MITLGETLTITFPREQVHAIIALLTKQPWDVANPAITTIMNAAKADADAKAAPPPPAPPTLHPANPGSVHP